MRDKPARLTRREARSQRAGDNDGPEARPEFSKYGGWRAHETPGDGSLISGGRSRRERRERVAIGRHSDEGHADRGRTSSGGRVEDSEIETLIADSRSSGVGGREGRKTKEGKRIPEAENARRN